MKIMSKRQLSIKEALSARRQATDGASRPPECSEEQFVDSDVDDSMLQSQTEVLYLSLSQATLSQNMTSVVMNRKRCMLTFYRLHINQGLGFSQRGNLARNSLSIAVLSPAGLITSLGLTGFTGKVVIIKYNASYVEMCMF